MFPYKEALVTGASRGLGKAFANALLAQGVTVWGTSRDGQRLPVGVQPLSLDLSSPESLTACIAQLRENAPEIDLIINNAGGGVFCPFSIFPAESLDSQWQTLLAAPISLCREFYPLFARRCHGAIVNVTSLAGTFPIPCMSAYSAAKAGLGAFTRTLMLEAAGTGVAVIDLQPGDYATDFNASLNQPEHNASPWSKRVWQCCEEHVKNAPSAEHAARKLLRALQHQRSRVLITGSFFQATLGPLMARLLPEWAVRWYLRQYYT
ncbi:MAG: SDR family NAD(P)-dependent oxidoreductase [Puniceicoccales bacterium]|jgi:short-subunit dehydrogenase|nr:SDR family NAD(P)-dependent oxidoreductase [Puniceicoccales bacterium]